MPLFKPPFRGLLPLLWLFFVLCFVLHPRSAIMQSRFGDPDDAMYALQSAELLDGQDWYDNAEYRLNPPVGTALHFSRLLEIPYAATIGLLTPLLGRADALPVMAFIWPPLFLLALLLVFRQQARLFLPRKWIGLTALIAALSQRLLFDFMPGHIDHHGFALMLIALSCGFTLMMIASPRNLKTPALAGATLALALCIALETLPWLLAFSVSVGLWASLAPQRAKTAAAFGGGLSLSGLLLLPTCRAPADWLRPDIAAYSITYVALLCGIGLCLTLLLTLRQERVIGLRLVKAGLIAALGAMAFLTLFPQLTQGPFADVDQRLLAFLLPNLKESTPLIACTTALVLAACMLPIPLLALGVCLWQMRAHHGRNRAAQLWAMLAVMLVLSVALALFYESRYLPYTQLFGVLPLSFLLWRATRRAPPLRAAACVAATLFYPFGIMVFAYQASFTDAAFYPMIAYTPPCDVTAAATILNRQPGPPKLILNAMDQGPDLLQLTPHAVLSAPFHKDVSGNLDVMDFFRADTPGAAEKIARARRADYVLLCRYVERGYIQADPQSPGTALPHPFIQSLITGHAPAWLAPVAQDPPGDILLFQIK